MNETANLNLPYVMPSQSQKHVPVNEAIRALDALVQLSVLRRDLSAPPALPEEGQRFIVAANPLGAWANAHNRVAAFQDGGWLFYRPRPGWLCWITDENALVMWDGADWVPAPVKITELQSLSRFGLNTAADAANPFAAKLNRALFTARTAAEGGDGDVRLLVSKEATTDTAALIFQNGFSGRAEIGLAGDDDLVMKVSANGSAWTEALRAERTSGRLTVAGQIRFPAAQNASSDPNTLDDYREGSTAPTVSASAGTLGSASAALDYQKVGRWVSFQATVTITTAGSGAGILAIPLPFAAGQPASASGVETAMTGAAVTGTITGSTLSMQRFDGATIIGSGRTVRIGGKYPAAA